MKLSDLAYERFRDALFDRRLQLGTVVSQGELMELLQVPLTPLRDALQRLHGEGLVEVLPRSGIRILKPDMELIRHTYQLRMMIEREAIRYFARTVTQEEAQAWIERHRAVRQQVEDGGNDIEALRASLQATDRAFHTASVATLGNPFIDEVYRQTHDRVALIRLEQKFGITPPMARATLDEHEAILKALLAHDSNAAARAMDAHLTAAMHRAMGV